MLDFSGNDAKAKLIALYYADKLMSPNLLEILSAKRNVADREEAIVLAKFYWKMLDASVQDEVNHVEVLGEVGLQFWMERLLNIVGGYLAKIGYEDEWNNICDQA